MRHNGRADDRDRQLDGRGDHRIARDERGMAQLAAGLGKQGLFRALPSDVQARIKAEASATSPSSDAYFDRDLATVADAFEVWRYIHEQHPVDTDLAFLQRLARAVEVALAGLS